MNAIDVRDVSVMVGDRALIRNASFRVERGTWTTLIGPNGAGKTTLIEAVGAVRRVNHGHVFINEKAIHTLNERARAAELAFVPQRPIVPPGMSVHDYVALGRTAQHGILVGLSPTDHDVINDVMERLMLVAFANRDVSTLSGGERQRAVIARALAQSVSIVLLDEPTTGLDVRHQIETLALLRHEVDHAGLTVLATLHDLTLAGQFADELVLLENAHIVAYGASRDVIRSHELVSAYGIELDVIDVDGRDVVVPRH